MQPYEFTSINHVVGVVSDFENVSGRNTQAESLS
jgi:hypothetical protein